MVQLKQLLFVGTATTVLVVVFVKVVVARGGDDGGVCQTGATTLARD